MPAWDYDLLIMGAGLAGGNAGINGGGGVPWRQISTAVRDESGSGHTRENYLEELKRG